MKKAILVGNGFSSQILSELKSNVILNYLSTVLEDDFLKINSFFQNFRLSPSAFQPPFEVYYGQLFDEEDCPLQPRYIYENPIIRLHVCNVLSKMGFTNTDKISSQYFFQDGLAYEIYREHFASMESPFKIAEMVKKTNLLPFDLNFKLKIDIKEYFVNCLKKYGYTFPESSNIAIYKKSYKFFQEYSTIFTTNYDLFLDSLVHDKVKHLHGGLNFASPYEKSNNSIFDDCYLIIGAGAQKKLAEMKSKKKESLFKKYFESLSTEDFAEFHIFGYSGENDQHINNAIRNNRRIKNIVFFAAPNMINDQSYHFMISNLFCKYSRLELRSWNEIWDKLK